jgi:hypothetical protein
MIYRRTGGQEVKYLYSSEKALPLRFFTGGYEERRCDYWQVKIGTDLGTKVVGSCNSVSDFQRWIILN